MTKAMTTELQDQINEGNRIRTTFTKMASKSQKDKSEVNEAIKESSTFKTATDEVLQVTKPHLRLRKLKITA